MPYKRLPHALVVARPTELTPEGWAWAATAVTLEASKHGLTVTPAPTEPHTLAAISSTSNFAVQCACGWSAEGPTLREAGEAWERHAREEAPG